jgi:hypothetical protein
MAIFRVRVQKSYTEGLYDCKVRVLDLYDCKVRVLGLYDCKVRVLDLYDCKVRVLGLYDCKVRVLEVKKTLCLTGKYRFPPRRRIVSLKSLSSSLTSSFIKT